MELTLLWAALTGVAGIVVGTRLWSDGLPDRPTDRLVGAAAIGLLVGRIVEMITQGVNPIAHPADIIVVRAGVHSAAATASSITAFAWAGRWEWRQLDAAAPSAVLGLAGWHAGCLWRDACLGSASGLPWAWAAEGSAITRHPVELYAAVALALAAFAIARLPLDGFLLRAGSALGMAALIRLVTEPIRPSLGGGPVAWYLAGMGAAIAIVLIGRVSSRRGRLPT